MADNILVRDSSGATRQMRTIDKAGVHIPVHRVEGYDEQDDNLKIKSIQKKFRESFADGIMPQWDASAVGAGMTVSTSAATLAVVTGTTAGSYWEMTSKEVFTVPFRTVWGVQTGATRPSNTHYMLEAVSIDPVTGLPDEKNAIQMDVGGSASTTTTQGVYGVQVAGMRSLISGASTIVSTTTYSIVELETFMDEAYFHSRIMDSTAGRSNSYVRHQSVPDPNALYKLRLRVMNHANWINVTNAISGTGGLVRLTVTSHGATTGNTCWIEQVNGVTNNGAMIRGNYTVTVVDSNTIELQGTVFSGSYVTGSGRFARGVAPSSSGTLSMQFINCQDYAELTAEITAGRGQVVEGQAVGVKVLGTASVSGTITVNATNQVYWNETTTNLTASQVYTSTMRETSTAAGSSQKFNFFRTQVLSSHSGTVRIEQSNDNVTWYNATVDVSYSANVPQELMVPVFARYFRVVVTNSASATTSFRLNTLLSAM
jgi:hypothetical protein